MTWCRCNHGHSRASAAGPVELPRGVVLLVSTWLIVRPKHELFMPRVMRAQTTRCGGLRPIRRRDLHHFGRAVREGRL